MFVNRENAFHTLISSYYWKAVLYWCFNYSSTITEHSELMYYYSLMIMQFLTLCSLVDEVIIENTASVTLKHG